MKKIIALYLSIACMVCSIGAVKAAPADEGVLRTMYSLGFVKGTGGTFDAQSLELDRYANRVEQATMIIRMLGKEEKAAWQKNSHPFYDVPVWASDNIGWLYENYVVNGIGDTYFGADETATVKQFSAMLLRVLGYNDSNGDFYYDESVSLASLIGLLDDVVASHEYLSRNDMFIMCYNALRTNMKNSRRSLASKLCDEGVINADAAREYGLFEEISITESFAGVRENLGNITVMNSRSGFKINFSDYIEEYGIRVFAREIGTNMIKEITTSGQIYLKKGDISYLGGGRAGYISELTVVGLDKSKQYEFIVIKTSSEGNLYEILGKSGTAYSSPNN